MTSGRSGAECSAATPGDVITPSAGPEVGRGVVFWPPPQNETPLAKGNRGGAEKGAFTLSLSPRE